MAGRIDTTAFYPEIPEGASLNDQVRILSDSLGRIHEMMAFSLGNIRFDDLLPSCREQIISEASKKLLVGVRSARLWSDYAEGEVILEGAFVIFKGILYKAIRSTGRYESFSPDSAVGNEFWQIAT